EKEHAFQKEIKRMKEEKHQIQEEKQNLIVKLNNVYEERDQILKEKRGLENQVEELIREKEELALKQKELQGFYKKYEQNLLKNRKEDQEKELKIQELQKDLEGVQHLWQESLQRMEVVSRQMRQFQKENRQLKQDLRIKNHEVEVLSERCRRLEANQEQKLHFLKKQVQLLKEEKSAQEELLKKIL
ncbi:MAG: hypothetical protein D6797_03180, partial [Bdellovibrio sp.]